MPRPRCKINELVGESCRRQRRERSPYCTDKCKKRYHYIKNKKKKNKITMDYDGSVLINRKLTDEETRELRIVVLPYFHASGGLGDEGITDFLDFAFEMVSNQQNLHQVLGLSAD